MIARTVRWASLLVSLAVVSACSSAGWYRIDRLVVEDRVVVEIETARQPDAMEPYEHPAGVSAADLAEFLRRLGHQQERRVGRAEPSPVIAEAYVDQLAKGIADGLGRCGRADRVRFWVDDAQTMLGVITVQRVTRGVVFVQPRGVLNLALDMIDETPDPEGGEEWVDPTRYTITSTRLVLPPGATLFRAPDGETEPLWLTVALADLPRGAPVERALPTSSRSDSSPLWEPPEEQATGGTSVTSVPTTAPGAPPASLPEASVVPEAAPAGASGIEEGEGPLTDSEIVIRLRQLEELHREGLLSTEDYRKKREALLLTPED